MMEGFWVPFDASVQAMSGVTTRHVIEKLNVTLKDELFPALSEGHDTRQCPSCKTGRLSLKLCKAGAFIGCTGYPACKFVRQLDRSEKDDVSGRVGQHPDGRDIFFLFGPYGPFVQLGGAADKDSRRVAFPQVWNVQEHHICPFRPLICTVWLSHAASSTSCTNSSCRAWTPPRWT